MLEMDAEAASSLFARVPKIAQQLREKLGASGVNIINNNEEAAGQTVFHTHVHLLPRFDATDGLKLTFETHEPDFAALAQLAQEVFLGE